MRLNCGPRGTDRGLRCPSFSLALGGPGGVDRARVPTAQVRPPLSSASSLSAFAVSASADPVGCSVSISAARFENKRNSRRGPPRRSARSAMKPALQREARVCLTDGWLIASTAASSFTDIGPRRASRLSTPIQRGSKTTPGWEYARLALRSMRSDTRRRSAPTDAPPGCPRSSDVSFTARGDRRVVCIDLFRRYLRIEMAVNEKGFRGVALAPFPARCSEVFASHRLARH